MSDITEKNVWDKIKNNKEKIGQLLLRYTTLTEKQLEEALSIQKENSQMLGEILLKKNYIHPHDIIKVICHQVNIPYLTEINIDEINTDLTNDISINYAKLHEILPISETDFSLSVIMTNPFNFDAINDLEELFNKDIKVLIASPLRVQDAINRVYEKANRNIVNTLEDEFDENLDLDGPIDILDAGADEAPVIRFVNQIIFRAVKERASDIHIEPYEKETIYRFRINGIMREILKQPLKTHAAVCSRIKVMGKMNIAEKRLPQDGRIPIKMAGKSIDIRLSTVPVQNGERIVMRILDKSSTVLDLKALGFHGKVLKELNQLSQRKHGVLYVTGPTGSGKTTTLSAILSNINDPEKMIITVEDPVEYEIPGVSQIQVNHKIDLGFSKALRSIVRQDPNVIMVGETRDFETAKMAIEASLTGHFVLSTLHTNDSASAPNRLIDMGVQPFLIASSLIGILAQRLIRPLCNECKERIQKITKGELAILGINKLPHGATIFKARGCPKCNHIGYDGQISISELLLISDNIRGLILQKAPSGELKKTAMENGMITLRDDALSKVFNGITSIDEMMRTVNQDIDED